MTDPFSVAVGAAALVSLSLQLFGGCIKGFVLLSKARNLGKDSSTIICMLHIQEVQLTEWGRRSGLLGDDGVLDRRLNASAVEATLQQLRDLLLDSKALKKKYGLAIEEGHDAQPQSVGQIGVSTGVSDDTRQWIFSKAGIDQDPGILKRLWWAAVDKDKISQLAADVQSLVRGLWELLDPWRQDDLLSSTKRLGFHLVALNDKFDQLSSLEDAFNTLRGSSNLSNSTLKTISVSAEVKALRVGLDEGELHLINAPKRHTLLKKLKPLNRLKLANFKPLKKDETMGHAEYDGEVVFVERKPIDRMLRSKIMPRAENIAALLNLPKDETFCSLTCNGIVEDDGMISFVFNHLTPNQKREPRSLLELFSAKGGIGPPSLTVRIRLALRITRTIQSIHRAGWLHKNVRSENIIFFQSKNTTDPSDILDDPFLVGFSFARADSPTEISEQPSADPKHDIYRHPAALGEPSESFSAIMDAYSLGTVLLEIAEWRALRYLVDSVVDISAESVPLDSLAGLQPFLLKGKGRGGTSKMKTKVGDLYTQACLQCLGGEVEEINGPSEIFGAKPSLVDLAVQRLGSCLV